MNLVQSAMPDDTRHDQGSTPVDAYTTGRSRTGHYKQPGSHLTYCGRHALARTSTHTKMCTRCVKAEARDRAEAEATANEHRQNAPTLAERAKVRYALVGKGRRVHYSNNDDTLCGRQVSEYTDGLDERHESLCTPCIRAAEKRAHSRALAAAAVDLPEIAEQTGAQFQRSARAVAAVEHAEHVEAAVEHAEALHAAALVTEADATQGTWRGDWIGEQADDHALFPVDRPADQGALFATN
ncbi:hypothetical protein [Streptomyces similanensis]|uniref:Uncharacterized protein n=1 Tax=Streptomyces similanensis TaxID=1274988 RepID=A0ABP9KD03_9ACTN